MSEIFDTTIALEQAAGSEELARELFTMLLAELPDHQQAIATAFTAVNSEAATVNTLLDNVHKLHGAAAYLGVPALREAAKAFEDQIRDNNQEQFAEGFKQLDTEIKRLLDNGQSILAGNW